jgi:hypothetical protein
MSRIRRVVRRTCRVDMQTLLNFLPILRWLPAYNWRTNLAVDAVAGVTVAIMHVPQGMGYAVLARLPPVYGLYTSLWPSIFYPFLGECMFEYHGYKSYVRFRHVHSHQHGHLFTVFTHGWPDCSACNERQSFAAFFIRSSSRQHNLQHNSQRYTCVDAGE